MASYGGFFAGFAASALATKAIAAAASETPSAIPSATHGAPAPQSSAPPRAISPRAISLPVVPYPSGAHGNAVVVVELLVGADGTVREQKIVDGQEPFATAALNKAPTWLFEAATRGDVTVAARIRVRVEFTEPKPVPPQSPTTPTAAAPTPPATSPSPAPSPISATAPSPNASAIEQVEVGGLRKEVGQTTLGGGEVRQLPGAFGDAFRAIEALPGVTPILSGLPFFYVRGAPPGNTGYFLDGIKVPLLFHLGLGPSVVHPGMIDHVDFYPGGFPAKFGRFAGGILSGEIRPPATDLHGEASIRPHRRRRARGISTQQKRQRAGCR